MAALEAASSRPLICIELPKERLLSLFREKGLLPKKKKGFVLSAVRPGRMARRRIMLEIQGRFAASRRRGLRRTRR